MLAEMKPGQLAEWMEHERHEPFGFNALADLTALLCAVVANNAPFRDGPGLSPEQFRYRPGRERPPEQEGGAVLSGAETVGPDLSRPITD